MFRFTSFFSSENLLYCYCEWSGDESDRHYLLHP
nr:MAG TPA: hypothetical protein [Caudoviricetes sp.]